MEDNNWNWICDDDYMILYFINPPVVDAGQDATIYANETYTLTQATAGNYDSLLWTTSGDGAIDDPTQTNPSYTPGLEDIISGSVELCLTGTTLDPDYCDDATACMQLFVTGYGLQPITLEQGWAGISSYLNPFEQDMEALMEAISDQLIILRDIAGNYYQPGNKELFNWEHTKGYYIKMASQAALEVEGVYPLSGQLDLQQGWNLIPVLSDEPVELEELLFTNTGKVDIVTEVAGLKLYWPDMEIATLQELLPGKAYLVKAKEPFALSALPIVTTAPVADITAYTAISGGEVTNEGSSPVTVRGVVWSVLPNPTTTQHDGITADGEGVGAYVSEVIGLTSGTTYYLRSYATNHVGTAYGEELSFTTFWECSYPFTDPRDGQTYNTVQIGDQCWMAQNLNYQTGECYDYNTANCNNYGRLYTWQAALTACPPGWHLPTDAEWTALTTYVSSQPEYLCNSNTSYIAKALAATTNWNTSSSTCAVGNNLSANNATGFTALPGGYRSTGGSFYDVSYYGHWWSSSQRGASDAWLRRLYCNYADVLRYYLSKSYGFSVRCLKDN
jgi:uncharacterized protein (TIGR02145 family)